jgi:hypothetical protein
MRRHPAGRFPQADLNEAARAADDSRARVPTALQMRS